MTRGVCMCVEGGGEMGVFESMIGLGEWSGSVCLSFLLQG